MSKFLMMSLLLAACSLHSMAQDGNTYDDFKIYRNTAEDKPEAIMKMKMLLADSAKLTSKQLTNINYHIGRLFEELELPDSAEIYYNQTLKGEPNYEVVHRGLGFIYLDRSKTVAAEMEKIPHTEKEARAKLYAIYKEIVLKAIPHFEKYQACDPDDDTLGIILMLHQTVKSGETQETINERIKKLGGNCVTLLDDD